MKCKIKIIVIICTLALLISFSFAWLLADWERIYFGGVLEDSDGSLIFHCSIPSEVTPELRDILFMKTDREGGELLRKTISYGFSVDMEFLSDGKIAICGKLQDDTLITGSAFIALFNTDGDTIWLRTFSVFTVDSEVSYAYDMYVSSDTIFISCFEEFTPDSFAILKINRYGNLISYYFIQSDFWVGEAPFIVRGDGGFSMIIPEMYPYDRSKFLNLDTSGEIICSVSYNISIDTTIKFKRIFPCISGGYYLTGKQYPGPECSDQSVIARIDECGEFVWRKTIPDTAIYNIYSLFELSSGELDLIVGHTWNGYSGIGLMHCNSIGDSIWMIAIDDDSLEPMVHAVYKCSNEDYVICGKYWSDPIYQGYIMRIDKLGNSVPITSVKEATLIPDAIVISHYPNPFNSSTRISVVLPESESISLTIYDIAGREIRSLHDGMLTAGEHSFEWNGKDNTGNEMPSGVYLYRFRTIKTEISDKMLLVK